MRFALLPIFIISSLTELTILITMGRYIGIWWTILIVAGTAFIGTMVLRQQGLRTLAHINKSMARGVPPVEPLVEGFLIVIAGALLLTPGIITDVIGFSLLVPQLRQRVAIWGLERFLSRLPYMCGHPKKTGRLQIGSIRARNHQDKMAEVRLSMANLNALMRKHATHQSSNKLFK